MPQNPDYASYSASRTAQASQAGGFNAPGDSGSSLFDRVPPHDPAAEMAVLGGMLMSKEAVGEVSELIVSSDFYDPKNQMFFVSVFKL